MFFDDEKIAEHIETVDKCIVAMWNDVAPLLAIVECLVVGGDDAKVFCLPVRAENPLTLQMLNAILVIAFARDEYIELERGILGFGDTRLGRYRAFGGNDDVFFILGRAHARVETLVV